MHDSFRKRLEKGFPVIFSLLHFTINQGVSSSKFTLINGDFRLAFYYYIAVRFHPSSAFGASQAVRGCETRLAPQPPISFLSRWLVD